MPGFSDVLVGLQYGDEGKAKIIDLLTPEYDIIARFNGGANAGHTVVTDHGTARLRQIPSGVLHADKLLYIGSGCAVNLVMLVREINELKALGVSLKRRLFISSRAKLVQARHVRIDRLEGETIGTTGNGIGPCYADLALRIQGGRRVGLQFRDLQSRTDATLSCMSDELLSKDCCGLEKEHSSHLDFSVGALTAAWDALRQYIVDDTLFLTEKVESGARVLFEGAQSILLDVSEGDQPFVTASHTVPEYAYVGGDLNFKYHRKTIGVVKAIVSRVGNGPFPSELGGSRSEEYCSSAAKQGRGYEEEALSHNVDELLESNDDFDLGLALRLLTKEYGTGSGRPRRLGLLDLPQLRRVIHRYGVNEIYVNKIDCLSIFGRSQRQLIPLIESYDIRSSKPVIRNFPAFSEAALENASKPTLPAELKSLLSFLTAYLECEISGIGIGPGRQETILLKRYQTP
jgi:adenylosuccinate synthase